MLDKTKPHMHPIFLTHKARVAHEVHARSQGGTHEVEIVHCPKPTHTLHFCTRDFFSCDSRHESSSQCESFVSHKTVLFHIQHSTSHAPFASCTLGHHLTFHKHSSPTFHPTIHPTLSLAVTTSAQTWIDSLEPCDQVYVPDVPVFDAVDTDEESGFEDNHSREPLVPCDRPRDPRTHFHQLVWLKETGGQQCFRWRRERCCPTFPRRLVLAPGTGTPQYVQDRVPSPDTVAGDPSAHP